jgi:adenylate cyclase
VTFRPIGVLVLYGKKEPVEVYEPLTEDGSSRIDLPKYLEAYALMRDTDSSARGAFEALAAAYPEDPIAAFHAGRLAAGETGIVIKFEGK